MAKSNVFSVSLGQDLHGYPDFHLLACQPHSLGNTRGGNICLVSFEWTSAVHDTLMHMRVTIV